MSGEALVELRKVHQSFRLDSGGTIKVLKDINIALHKDEILILLGPSGSGKSTCLRNMAGLIEPTQGKVLLHDQALEGVNREMAMVFQSFALLPWLTVQENVALGVKPLNLPPAEVRSRTDDAIHVVGLEGFETAYPKELSGGMKQRVGIARALVMRRPILALDEPFSALDVLTAETLRKEVVSLWLSKKTSIQSVLMITHNITEAVSMGTRILVMGANPGVIRYDIKNDLPFPRDEKTAAFKAMVESVHGVLTQSIIPDKKEWVPPSAVSNVIETIPHVSPGDVIGFLERLAEANGRADIYELSQKMMKDSMHTLLVAKAAELLDFVDTPGNQVVITDGGRQVVKANMDGRKELFHKRTVHLKIMQNFLERLGSHEDKILTYDEAQKAIHEWLPNENPRQVFDTLIQWGRFAELLVYNAETKRVTVPAS
jgi:NitT/TauT family transport system ATP-binding protein